MAGVHHRCHDPGGTLTCSPGPRLRSSPFTRKSFDPPPPRNAGQVVVHVLAAGDGTVLLDREVGAGGWRRPTPRRTRSARPSRRSAGSRTHRRFASVDLTSAGTTVRIGSAWRSYVRRREANAPVAGALPPFRDLKGCHQRRALALGPRRVGRDLARRGPVAVGRDRGDRRDPRLHRRSPPGDGIRRAAVIAVVLLVVAILGCAPSSLGVRDFTL